MNKETNKKKLAPLACIIRNNQPKFTSREI